MKFGKPHTFTFGKKRVPFTFGDGPKIKDVPAIKFGTNININSKEDLEKIVELPCLKACEYLFENNIQTTESGCNGENCSDKAYIEINYETLDDINKIIADSLINENLAIFIKKDKNSIRQFYDLIRIVVPTTPEETTTMVERKLLSIVTRFVAQEKIIIEPDLSAIFEQQGINGAERPMAEFLNKKQRS